MKREPQEQTALSQVGSSPEPQEQTPKSCPALPRGDPHLYSRRKRSPFMSGVSTLEQGNVHLTRRLPTRDPRLAALLRSAASPFAGTRGSSLAGPAEMGLQLFDRTP